jgi:hypothetical protein
MYRIDYTKFYYICKFGKYPKSKTGTMKNIALFNESFNISNTATYFLSLQISSDFYSYCIIDSIRDRFVAIKHQNFQPEIIDKSFSEKVSEMLKTDAFLNKNYKKVDFSFISQKYTLIPAALFNKERLKDFFTFNVDLNPYEELHFNKLTLSEANLVFAIPSEITTLLVNRFPEIKFYHQGTSLIFNLLSFVKEKNINSCIIQADLHGSFFDLTVVIGGKLILYNTFSYPTENDFIYFFLNALSQLNIKPDAADIFLSGDFERKSDFYKQLQRFIGNFRLLGNLGKTTYSFTDVPEYQFSNLLNLSRCE